MTRRFLGPCGLALAAAAALGGSSARAQVAVGVGVAAGPAHPLLGPGYPGRFGPGWYGGVGPYDWGYPGLAGGPFLTTAYPFWGWPGYVGGFGSFWTNGLSLYGPPVPVYGPLPGVMGNSDFVRQWHARPTLGAGFGYVGWVGPFAASPRLGRPSVNVMPTVEALPAAAPHLAPAAAPAARPAPAAGPCLHLSVRVPQPAAEVLIDGVKTRQTGTDRTFESPPLEPGKEYRYELTARWLERGVPVERTRVVTGKPGEVVRVDFLAPDVVPTGR